MTRDTSHQRLIQMRAYDQQRALPELRELSFKLHGAAALTIDSEAQYRFEEAKRHLDLGIAELGDADGTAPAEDRTRS